MIDVPNPNRLSTLRTYSRMLHVFAHLAKGLATVQFAFPFCNEERRRVIKKRWAQRLVAVLGVRLQSDSLDLPEGALIVCNHISWIDIFVINALSSTTFVCKDDVRHWPVIGWLVKNTGAVFIERGNKAAAIRTTEAMAERLRAGERIVFFPEGTTTDGSLLLPFRAALFQAASASSGLIPLALRYLDANGQRHPAPAYDGDITFGQCLRAIASATDLYARIDELPTLPTNADRRELAAQSHHMLAVALGVYGGEEDVAGETEEGDGAQGDASSTYQSAPGC